MSQKYFRATFMDAACPDMQLTIEFEAPYPRKKEMDYRQLALRSFERKIKLGHIKIRDIEPVES